MSKLKSVCEFAIDKKCDRESMYLVEWKGKEGIPYNAKLCKNHLNDSLDIIKRIDDKNPKVTLLDKEKVVFT